LFFWAVLAVYAAMNAYILARLFQTLSGCGIFRGMACVALCFFALCFPLGRLLASILPDGLYRLIAVLGYLYISPMIYGFLITAVADVLRLLNGIVAITHTPPPFSLGARVNIVFTILLMSLLVTLAGAWNAYVPAVVRHEIRWGAERGAAAAQTPGSIRIAIISDLHLGAFRGAGYLKKIVGILSSENPDIVLFAGDTVDDAAFLRATERRRAAADVLSSLKPRLGAWAVMGNHDYYAGADEFKSFLDETPVRLLRDEAVKPEGELLLVGRDDRTVMRIGGRREGIDGIIRKYVGEYGRGDGSIPMIVMDHQPFDLEDSENSGATLQVSGHTHRGQLFPVNLIVALMYEKHYGLYRKGATHYYISSGVGVWGPPVRTVGRPEVVILDLRREGA
jgi:predicted MPP superfamily phosphohydrolase